MWIYERLLFPQTPVEPYVGSNVPWPEHSRQAAGPVGCPYRGGRRDRKRPPRHLRAHCVVALYTPVQLATIDQISGGRVIAGLGNGWATDELRATGATRADRRRFLDETLDVFDAVWGPDPVNFRGPRVVVDNAAVLPKPVARIPVLLGGGGHNLARGTTSKTLWCIAKRADGWLPLLTTPGPGGSRATAGRRGPHPGHGMRIRAGREPDGDDRRRQRHLHRPPGRTRPDRVRRHARSDRGRFPDRRAGGCRRADRRSQLAKLVSGTDPDNARSQIAAFLLSAPPHRAGPGVSSC
ncbi:LLM class flavin-dependent oxidoreductase [Mycobacterium tilburgii]|uniref:LLM class flavin-dependent oxidoreductase n=1 Tax=Mycobacterium tilburgii TaxID=44467 RepID=UPI0028C46CE8|nr:LLM class flavin-dependent oxidoreductase [Mycobacterium tilburgii]